MEIKYYNKMFSKPNLLAFDFGLHPHMLNTAMEKSINFAFKV